MDKSNADKLKELALEKDSVLYDYDILIKQESKILEKELFSKYGEETAKKLITKILQW